LTVIHGRSVTLSVPHAMTPCLLSRPAPEALILPDLTRGQPPIGSTRPLLLTTALATLLRRQGWLVRSYEHSPQAGGAPHALRRHTARSMMSVPRICTCICICICICICRVRTPLASSGGGGVGGGGGGTLGEGYKVRLIRLQLVNKRLQVGAVAVQSFI